MKIKFKKKTSAKRVARLTRKIRIRKTVNGTAERPRLCIYRSGKHFYAQAINDVTGQTILASSSLKIQDKLSGKARAEAVGREVAEKLLTKEIKNIVFDRNGFVYHGRVKALADAARAAGLKF